MLATGHKHLIALALDVVHNLTQMGIFYIINESSSPSTQEATTAG